MDADPRPALVFGTDCAGGWRAFALDEVRGIAGPLTAGDLALRLTAARAAEAEGAVLSATARRVATALRKRNSNEAMRRARRGPVGASGVTRPGGWLGPTFRFRGVCFAAR